MEPIEKSYSTLRAQVLARHFALGRYFPAFHFTNGHVLGEFATCQLPTSGKLRIACDLEGCFPRARVPQHGGTATTMQPRYADAAGLLRLQEPRQTIERWRVWRRDRTNSLLMAGMRVTGLAIEYQLGLESSAQAIERWLATIETLFKFRHLSSPMQGYVLRWDAASSDRWEADVDAAGVETPILPCEFLLDPDPRRGKAPPYLACTSAQDSRYAKARQISQDGQDRWRRWEPSMDEYIGLVAAYLAIFDAFGPDLTRTIAGDAAATTALRARAARLIDRVKTQTRRVARYLQAHAYVMVRPCGGVTIRGAGETNPCMGYAFNKAFERILGESFPVTRTFDQVMQIAGLADCISRAPVVPDLVGAIAQLRQSGVWQRLQELFGNDPMPVLNTGTADATAALIRAAGFQARSECFDVLASDQLASGPQFALCSVLCDYARAHPDQAWKRFVALPDPGAHAFKVVAGLYAVSTQDATLRDGYLSYFDGPMRHLPGAITHDPSALTKSGAAEAALPTAIALQLQGDNPQREATLRASLAQDLSAMAKLLNDQFANQPIVADDDDGIAYSAKEPDAGCCAEAGSGGKHLVFEYGDKVGSWHGFMAAAALAWRHARLTRTTRPWAALIEPGPDRVNKWPEPVLPAAVAARAAVERIIVAPAALQRAGNPPSDVRVLDVGMPAKPDDGELPFEAPAAPVIKPFQSTPNLLPGGVDFIVSADVPPPDPSPAYLLRHELVATVVSLIATKADVPAPAISGNHVTLTVRLHGTLEWPLNRIASVRGELVCSWLPKQSFG